MPGILYGIGVGPGDPELITIKAKKVLESVDYIAVPKTSGEKDSLALTIVNGILEQGKGIIHLVFPMSYDENVLESHWGNAVSEIKDRLDSNKDVAFITLGDPTVYSTFAYIDKELKRRGYKTVALPGITSFCASAAGAGISLAENSENLAVIPSSYEFNNFDYILDNFDNIVLMKVSKNFAALREKLRDKGLIKNTVLVSRCGFDDQLIEYDIDNMTEKKLSYFTTMIIKKNGVS